MAISKYEKDEALVGTWTGETMDEEKQIYRTWVQRRDDDGTYSIIFIQIEPAHMNRTVEVGNWWVTNGVFYEIAPELMNAPDAYDYRLIGPELIEFTKKDGSYSFKEKKIR